MMHYHLTLVQECNGASVTEEIGIDSHRVCLQNTRAELMQALLLLGYEFLSEGSEEGRETVTLEFQHGDGGTVEWTIAGCDCSIGRLYLMRQSALQN